MAEQRRYHAAYGPPLLHDYAQRELASGERLVMRKEHWLAVVPYWATWPFETLLMPLDPVRDLTPEQAARKLRAVAV